jgi:hypothetical protein
MTKRVHAKHKIDRRRPRDHIDLLGIERLVDPERRVILFGLDPRGIAT